MTDVDQLRQQITDLRTQVRRLRWTVGVTILILGMVAGLLVRTGQDVDRGADASDRAAAAAEDVQGYVDELRTVTPEEEDRNALIGATLTAVPGIAEDADVARLAICEAFPELSACLAPDRP